MKRQQFLNEKITRETTVLALGYQILCHGKHIKPAKRVQKNENRAKYKFLRKAICCNLQHFLQNKATDSRSVLVSQCHILCPFKHRKPRKTCKYRCIRHLRKRAKSRSTKYRPHRCFRQLRPTKCCKNQWNRYVRGARLRHVGALLF